ncbi:putative uncharacterized protein DDB_G0274535 [Leptidea sinapis]|uniref:putative uncharacterized protein DDB_G0274535 n=1 Tax=Leptidea sinapis TaxID=189913 RepID=UPI002141C85B|nr:putative uncharacterized protein DDB_G0274535 [Leptidea sinapis]
MPSQPNSNLVIKRHNIRIWCHECDMGRLQRVIWEGQGSRLLSEVSNQPVVKKFLEAVPYIMNSIKDIHSAVIENDLEGLIRLTNDPVPPQILSSIDANNMTVFHKAAGLGHGGILKYIIDRYPQGINALDNENRTPLHYAAIVKDDKHTYKTLIEFGADEGAVDSKNKTPAYYLNRSSEIDKNHLKIIPEAPRTPSNSYPPSWDWKILDIKYSADLNKKARKKKLKSSSENISSKNTSNTISESTEYNNNNNNAMKNSSTRELIDRLPELNDSNEQSSIVEEPNIEVVSENTHSTEPSDMECEDRKNNLNDATESQDINLGVQENKNVSENDTEFSVAPSTPDKSEQITQNDKLVDGVNDKLTDKAMHSPNAENVKSEENTELKLDDDGMQLNLIQENPNAKEGNFQELNDIDVETNVKNIADEESNTEQQSENHIDQGNHLGTADTVENIDKNFLSELKTQDDNLKEHHYINETKDLNKENNSTDIQTIVDNIRKPEEETSITLESEGNNKLKHGEDDDDVQTQGDSQTEHTDIYIGTKDTQINGSAIRDARVSSGTTHEL